MRQRKHPWIVTTGVDTQLHDRYQLHQFDLARLRQEFHLRGYGGLPAKERRALAEGKKYQRIAVMVRVLRGLWSQERWAAWLRHTEHSQRDIDDMCRGEYPISPYLIRIFSALFGIKIDWLLLGTAPEADRVGADIDIGQPIAKATWR